MNKFCNEVKFKCISIYDKKECKQGDNNFFD